MQHLLEPYSKKIEPFAWWEGAFTEEQLNWLQQKAKEANTTAKVGESGAVDNDIRRSELNWMPKNENTEWVFETLAHIVSTLNAEHFGFNLTGLSEQLQLANYREDVKGTYGWHQDFGAPGVSRKMSLVLQLSDPEEYEGGQLQLLIGKEPINIKKKKGLIVVFPSWTVHQVTPVVKGTRQTLVTWVSGPAFT